MKKATQKLLCILLVAILICATNPIATFAEQQAEIAVNEEGTMSVQMFEIGRELPVLSFDAEGLSMVEIGSADELIQYRNGVNSGEISNAILISDINLEGYCAESWTPIGTADFPFSGTFNGNGFRISNLCISSDIEEVQALFGYVSQNGVISNLTVDGNVDAQNAAGLVGQNDGTVSNCCNEAVVLGQNVASGIAVLNNGLISNCINKGYIKSEIGSSGGIAGHTEVNSSIINSSNSANIHGDTMVGGIAGNTKGTVSGCVNIGEIYSKTSMVGGIVGKAENIIENCTNNGVVTGKTYVGGILGRVSAEMHNNKNYGEIYATGSYSGGIAGYAVGGTSGAPMVLEKCINYADVFLNDLGAGIVGAISGYVDIEVAYNYGDITAKKDIVGGIVGRVGYWDGKYYVINKAANFGTVKTNGNYIGGICARLTQGEINNSYNTGEIICSSWGRGGIVGNAGSNVYINNSFNYSQITVNFSNATCDNVYMLASTDSGTSKTSASFKNGTVLALLGGDVWKQGPKYPIFIDDISETGVDTEEKLISVLQDNSISEIVLSDDIQLTQNIKISRDVTINGYNHSIDTGSSTIFVDTADVEIKNISFKGNRAIISASDSNLVLSSTVKFYNYISTGILAENTKVTFSPESLVWSAPEEIIIDSDVEQDNADIYTVQNEQGRCLYKLEDSQTVYNKTSKIVVKADDNTGVSYDVYSLNKGNNTYLMLPSCASKSAVTYTTVDANGVELQAYTKDFSEETEYSIQMGYATSSLIAMQSTLPTLYIEVDEKYGTIDAMHSDPEHDTKAYGQMQIDVPDELVEKYGWDKVYKSKEGDEEKPGSMEIKGRGNSTWNTTPGVKKPYQVKSEKKVDFLGMGKAKTWCLLKSGEKQKFGLDLGLAMGINYTPDSRFVEVYMNGEYYGYYAMTEKVEIKEERVEITDLEEEVDENGITPETDLTGGYLMEIDNYSTDPIRIITNGNPITIKSPENLDSSVTASNNYGYIYNYLNELFDAIYGDGTMNDGSTYLDHIDVESFVKYYWHQEFIANFDCGMGSTYMYKDSDNIDHKLYAGPIWDSDNMLKVTEGWYAKYLERYDGTDSLYNRLLQRKDFTSYAIWYYENELKYVIEDAYEIASEYQEYLPMAKSMDYIKWGVNEYGTGTTMVNQLSARAEWIDAHYAELLNDATVGSEIDVAKILNTPTPYAIRGITITNSAGEEIDSISADSTIDVNVNLITSVDRESSDKIIVVCYDDQDKMVATNSAEVMIPSKTAMWTTVSITIGNHNVKKIKVFVWKDFDNVLPLCDLREIEY